MACSIASLLLASVAFLKALEFLKLVKVPGMTRKLASKIQVNTAARILWSLGMLSNWSNISMYRVCTDGTRARAFGLAERAEVLAPSSDPMAVLLLIWYCSSLRDSAGSENVAALLGFRLSESSSGMGDKG